MTPTFAGQAVLGAATSLTASLFVGSAAQEDTWLGNSPGTTTIPPCSEGGPAIAVTGVLTGTTGAAVTVGQNQLKALAEQIGPLLVPTGRTAAPSAVVPAATIAVLSTIGSTSVTVASAAGLVVGEVVLVQSATRTGVADQAVIASISGTTVSFASPLAWGYNDGDTITPLAAQQPYQTLYPGGGAGPQSYPGWDTYSGYYFSLTDLVFGSTTGSGPYQCTYALVFRRAPGSSSATG